MDYRDCNPSPGDWLRRVLLCVYQSVPSARQVNALPSLSVLSPFGQTGCSCLSGTISGTYTGLVLVPLVERNRLWRSVYPPGNKSPREYILNLNLPTLDAQARTDPWTDAADWNLQSKICYRHGYCYRHHGANPRWLNPIPLAHFIRYGAPGERSLSS